MNKSRIETSMMQLANFITNNYELLSKSKDNYVNCYDAAETLEFCNTLLENEFEKWKLKQGNKFFVQVIDTSSRDYLYEDVKYTYAPVVITDIAVDFDGKVTICTESIDNQYARCNYSYKNALEALYIKINKEYYTVGELLEIQ